MNNYMKERWRKRRLSFIEKLGGKCNICGSTENLEFDHIDPEVKNFTIAIGSSYSDKRLEDELKKCQLLCYICHINKHSVKDYHGTLNGYRHKKCKCYKCKEAWNTYHKELKRKKKLNMKDV